MTRIGSQYHKKKKKILITVQCQLHPSRRKYAVIQTIFSHEFDSLLLSIPSVEINLKPFKFAITII
jgi:hypothetical protein